MKINYTVFLALFFSLISASAQQQGKAIIEGRVFNEKNNEPLPFAIIIIYGTTIGSISDLDGNFLFTGIEPGFIRLQVSSVGFETHITEEFQATSARRFYIEIPVKEASISLSEVTVKASPFRKQEESPVSLKTIQISEIEKNPGGNRDISKVLQSFPGVGGTVSFRNDLIIRGGGPSENRFYLDGIEIPNLNHFATQGASGGAVGVINVDFIRQVQYYSGAFPASRGNTLSSVFEFSQFDGNKEKLKFKGAVGATDLALALNGPLAENTTFFVSARRSYLQLLFAALQLPFLPTYNDFQFKVKSRLNAKNEISFIGIGAIDYSTLNLKADETPEQRYILEYLPENKQWNYAIGAVYKHFQEKGFYTVVLSRNLINNSSYKYEQNNTELGKTFDYSSGEAENKLRFEHFSRTADDYKIVYGFSSEFAKYNNKTTRSIFANDTSVVFNYNSELNLIHYGSFIQISRAYLQRRLTLSAGARLDGTNYSAEMANPLRHFSPRVSASWQISNRFFLNANTGRYYQRPAYTTFGYRDASGSLVNKENGLTYIRADHIVAGIEYRASEKSIITVEGFYKKYDNYPFSLSDSISLASKGGDYGTFGDEVVKSVATGRSYGFEIYSKTSDLFGFNTTISYTFVISQFRDLDNNLRPLNTYTSTSWDNRHIFFITSSRRFSKNWFAGFKWRFVGAAPYTEYDVNKSSIKAAWDAQGRAYPDYANFNKFRLKPFHQLDVRVDKEYYFKKWSLNIYVDIQNLYNKKSATPDYLVREALYYGHAVENDPYVDDNGIERYRLVRVPSDGQGTVLPTIGIIIEF